MKNKVNYNAFSSYYDNRYQASSLKDLENSLLAAIKKIKPKKILEVGCGTGHWLKLFENKFVCIGIDSSIGMLKVAKKANPKSFLICADANNFPLREKKFDFIFCVNAIHQFQNKKNFIQSIASLLRSRGKFYVYGLDPYRGKHFWYVYDYFVGIRKRDLKRFPKFSQLKVWMEKFGFHKIEIKLIEKISNRFIGDGVFNDTFLQKNQSSQLSLISDKAYSSGIKKIKAAILDAKKNKRTIKFAVKLNFYLLKGQLF